MRDPVATILRELYFIMATMPKKPIIYEKFIDCEIETMTSYKTTVLFISFMISSSEYNGKELDCEMIVKENEQQPVIPPKPGSDSDFVPIEDETIPWFAQDYDYEVEYEEQNLIKEEWFSYE